MDIYSKIKSFIQLIFILIFVVSVHYLIISTGLRVIVKNYPIVLFMICAFSSFMSIFIILYFLKIRKIKNDRGNLYWKDYWNVAELVWLLSAFVALLIGINKYTENLNTDNYNLLHIALKHEIEKEQHKIDSLIHSAESIINRYNHRLCQPDNIMPLAVYLCEYAHYVKKTMNDRIELKNNIDMLLNSEQHVKEFYRKKLEYLSYVLSDTHSSDDIDYWNKQILYFVDRHKLKKEYILKYSMNIASCNNNDDSFCNFLSIYFKDKLYGDVDLTGREYYYNKIILIKQFYDELLMTNDELHHSNGFVGEISNSLLAIDIINNQYNAEKEQNITATKIDPNIKIFFQKLSGIIDVRLQFIHSLLPLVLGAAFGLRWSRAIAAFKL